MACLLTTSSLAKQAMALPRRPHHQAAKWQGLPNGLELSCPAEAGRLPLIVALAGGRGARPYAPARRVRFSELLGSGCIHLLHGAWPPRT